MQASRTSRSGARRRPRPGAFSARPKRPESSCTAVVSWLKNGDTDYLMVVNRDPNDDITLKATFADGTEIVRRDGTKVPAAAYADYFWLDPGDAAIFSHLPTSR